MRRPKSGMTATTAISSSPAAGRRAAPGALLVVAFAVILATASGERACGVPLSAGRRRPFRGAVYTLPPRSTVASSLSRPRCFPDRFGGRVPGSSSQLSVRGGAAASAGAGDWIRSSFHSVSSSSATGATAAVLILAGYHLRLLWMERGGEKTWRAYQADTREEWAKHVRKTEGWLYAVQTLRNAITAQVFLASTVLSLVTLICGRIWDLLRSATSVAERRMLTLQLVSIATPMLLSGNNFLQGARLMTHAGFMFPISSRGTEVDAIMRRTQDCQWLGLRWMYVSLGPIAWTVGGGRAFLASALILIKFFAGYDKIPEGT